MAIGFFKKLVIADRFAIVVNTVYSNPATHSSTDLAIASYCFAFQIYCDFAGYSDIAIGAARIMGYDLMTNFERPYAARSISDFWKRWHISLSSWFRDYLYIPLGGNRVSRLVWYRNLMLVFMVSGLWHGANWTFVCWGALHGLYLVLANWTEPLRARIRSLSGIESMPVVKGVLQVVITFHLVLVGWVFFRASSVSEAVTILGRMIGGGGPAAPPDLGLTTFDLLIGVGAVALLEAYQWLTRQHALPGMDQAAAHVDSVACVLHFGVARHPSGKVQLAGIHLLSVLRTDVRRTIAAGLLFVLLPLAGIELALRIGVLHRPTNWYDPILTAACADKVDFVFAGSSRVAAAIHAEAFARDGKPADRSTGPPT